VPAGDPAALLLLFCPNRLARHVRHVCVCAYVCVCPQEILRRYLLLSRSALSVREEELEVPSAPEAAAAAYATMTDDLAAVHVSALLVARA